MKGAKDHAAANGNDDFASDNISKYYNHPSTRPLPQTTNSWQGNISQLGTCQGHLIEEMSKISSQDMLFTGCNDI